MFPESIVYNILEFIAINVLNNVKNLSTFLFSGKNYWLFDGSDLLPDYPKKVNTLYTGVPKNAKAAFHDTEEGVTYFFKGDRYWRFSDRKQRIAGTKKGFPLSDEFEGLPSDITAAFADSNGKTQSHLN